MDKKYKEFKVSGRLVKGKFQIDKKEPTERGHVMISDGDAEVNNAQTRFTYLHYEIDKKWLADQKTKKEEK